MNVPSDAQPVQLRSRRYVPPWPHRDLDVDELLASGWRPVPFRQFVLKVHGRCNLACDYCYVFEGADQSWRRRPPQMSAGVLARTAARIAQHVTTHGLAWVDVVLHGGEPLLAGRDFIAGAAGRLRSALPDDVELRLALQTNGTLLDEGALEALLDSDVRVGVSLDGTADVHDAHRPTRARGGSHVDVLRALDLLRRPRYRRLYAGLLDVVDVWADPLATYEALLRHEPPAVDFLLPHANWASRPVGPTATAHGRWLVTVFDRWYGAPERETSVRLFEEIIGLALGAAGRAESVGLAPSALVVVETDGAIEHVDALKTAYEGAASTGLNVSDHPFDAALLHPQTAARQIGLEALAPVCRQCGLRAICGAGHYPHRFDPGTGFLNPSVYCDDLAFLIRHVVGRIDDEIGGFLAARRRPG